MYVQASAGEGILGALFPVGKRAFPGGVASTDFTCNDRYQFAVEQLKKYLGDNYVLLK